MIYLQTQSISAFRKRLRKRGYKNISIVRCKNKTRENYKNFYTVTANEPLANQKIVVEYPLIAFDFLIR